MNSLLNKLAEAKDTQPPVSTEPSKETPPAAASIVLTPRKKGGYKITRATMIIRANGNKLVPVDGYYYPEDSEAKELCDYYEGIGYLTRIL